MFLLWMLSSLFELLPEVGDPDKPRFVFFFDEAHLLFDDMPKGLVDKIVQVVKLVRSKGVGVYFITQSPSDIPDEVLAQLSNRVQHGLRAYTPAEQKAVRAAAASFRENPAFDSAQALQDLGTGEALVSLLDEEGRPSVVERARVLFPQCRMAAADADVMDGVYAAQADLMEKYGTAIDRESAYEQIQGQRDVAAANAQLAAERAAFEKERAEFEAKRQKEAERAAKEQQKAEEKAAREAERQAARAEAAAQKQAEREAREREKAQQEVAKQVGRVATSMIGSFGREVTRQLARGLMGSLRR